jgi:hypothetical protein
MGRRGRAMEPSRQPRTIHRLHIQREIVGVLPCMLPPLLTESA